VDGPVIQTLRPPDAGAAERIERLLQRVEAADGHQPISEPKRAQLHTALHPDPGSAPGPGAFVSVVLSGASGGELLGAAHLTGAGSDGDLAVEVVVDPAHRGADEEVADRLLTAALVEAGAPGAPGAPGDGSGLPPGTERTVRFWAHHATPDDDRIAAAHRLRLERELLQMRVPLPVEGPRIPLATRAFVPGADESAWLRVNNRAFVTHPEQGGWTLDTLRGREREPWFDPDGFLLHEVDGRLAGSCWTKVHATTDPPMGEIYVISVDPDFHGRGLGRALTLAGLDWLHGTGLEVGMLYVDGSNTPATTLYRSMGFVAHQVDRAYVGSVVVRPPD
jgi:mycothiol synthase